MNCLKRQKLADILQIDYDENLSKTIVAEDIQSMLPLNLMQKIIFSPKYRIKNNRITPHNLASKIITLCATLLCCILYVCRLYVNGAFPSSSFVRIFRHYANMVFYGTGLIINYLISIVKVNSNIRFVLNMQDVHAMLNSRSSFKTFIIGNWISMITIFVYYVFLIILSFMAYKHYALHVISGILFLICFDANMIYAIRLMNLLKIKIVLWTCALTTVETSNDKNILCRSLFKAYASILECYNNFENALNVLVSIGDMNSKIH